MTEDEVVTLRLPATARYIRTARLVGAGLTNELEFDLDELDDVRLAIGEVCALAIRFGASWLELQFTLLENALEVTGGGRPSRDADDSVSVGDDDDHVKLVRQILDVACAAHEIAKDDGQISFKLTFANEA